VIVVDATIPMRDHTFDRQGGSSSRDWSVHSPRLLGPNRHGVLFAPFGTGTAHVVQFGPIRIENSVL
jgi:hypothetical protein